MSWFKSKEEKQEQETLEAALAQVVFTPESKDDYEKRVGYAVEVIETSKMNKGVIFRMGVDDPYYLLWGDLELKRRLVEARIEAIVATNYSYNSAYCAPTSHQFYGLPVAKKRTV